jgi:hypothetical protein
MSDAPAAVYIRKSSDIVGRSGGHSSGQRLAVAATKLVAQETVTERLLEQLRAKDAQIEGMQTFMQSLNERLRESNLLMASLQQSLPYPNPQKTAEDVASQFAQSDKTTAKPKTTPTRRRPNWLRTVFRR